jgi:hypothetical protein
MAGMKNQGDSKMWPSLEWAERLYSTANVALILSLAVGVIATVLIVWMGNVKEAYLRRDLAGASKAAAEANARAAEAALQLGQLTNPRVVSPEMEAMLIKALSPFGPHQFVGVGVLPVTVEGAALAMQLVDVLKRAGLMASMQQPSAQMHIGVAHEVVATFTTGNATGEAFAKEFARIMNEGGIATRAMGGFLEKNFSDPRIGASAREGASSVLIVVGAKL